MVSRRYKVVEKPQADIKGAKGEELNYIAALVDGEGSLDIKYRQPRISVTMKSSEPLKLAKQYGHNWYVQIDKEHGSVYYAWYIQGRPLIDDFVDKVKRFSRVKSEQFKLLCNVLRILDEKQQGWKDEIRKIAKQLQELHHRNPVVTLEAARHLDETKPGWRKWVRLGTVIEPEP